MMISLVDGTRIRECLWERIENANDKIGIASAYCKRRAFESIAERVRSCVAEKYLITRWNKSDLVSEASDLETYLLAKQFGWEMYVDLSLHAKVYVVDSWFMVGSANLTGSGLLLAEAGMNHEACVCGEDEYLVANWLDRVRRNASLLDDKLYELIAKEVGEGFGVKGDSLHGYSSQVLCRIIQNRVQSGLFTTDMFWLSNPTKLKEPRLRECEEALVHDCGVLGVTEDASWELIAERFEASKGWQWLVSEVSDGERYFGSLAAALHQALCDDPAIYRKEAKELVTNLINWGRFLLPEVCAIDRPQYSQRVRILKPQLDQRS